MVKERRVGKRIWPPEKGITRVTVIKAVMFSNDVSDCIFSGPHRICIFQFLQL
jgi:hypothetical protein